MLWGTGCGTAGQCGAGGAGVCAEARNECDIQCGSGQYRHGDYCYHCVHSESEAAGGEMTCGKCGGDGLCAECKAGYGARDGECRTLEQIGLDRVAGKLREAGRAECTSPDLLTCHSETCAGSAQCGAFAVRVDNSSASASVKELFVDQARHPRRDAKGEW